MCSLSLALDETRCDDNRALQGASSIGAMVDLLQKYPNLICLQFT